MHNKTYYYCKECLTYQILLDLCKFLLSISFFPLNLSELKNKLDIFLHLNNRPFIIYFTFHLFFNLSKIIFLS